jgi:hypothetical protein
MQDEERERVFKAAEARGSGPVWLADPPGGLADPPENTGDGVLIETGSDGTFPVMVSYNESGTPTSIRIDLS